MSYNQQPNNNTYGGGYGGLNNNQQRPIMPGARPNIGGDYLNNDAGFYNPNNNT